MPCRAVPCHSSPGPGSAMALRQALGRGLRLGRGLLWRWLGGAPPAPARAAVAPPAPPPAPPRSGFLREAAARLGLRPGPGLSPGRRLLLLLFRQTASRAPRRFGGLAFSLGLALLEPALAEQRQAAEACRDIQVRARPRCHSNQAGLRE